LNKEGNAQPSFAQGGLWNKSKKRQLEESYLFTRSSSQRMTESVILPIGQSQALYMEENSKIRKVEEKYSGSSKVSLTVV
jgi:hypothetical protein